ncbi:hypothetical protein Back11_31840 [Paenibacillus baekrokdamisoli]|uniref:N,N-dimethylformamidase beta subunit-like C-terminal domain-containing protein n=1 Tax=Paenibacillus baekrokdamisoli TaxID=1712516 RepID=A0A3G9JFU3_9BACL|nr:N,N-dimethylformamidase beta subunit family domain-containing protein [Paenibacillus baekrokdamisoli]MBB3071651.1 hypothetical protein [Paenibacillus baekrokdamisoli]BBH21839.1 hypothetical protein Back11_31840 [Paenibacillus baekrokdamisoli]
MTKNKVDQEKLFTRRDFIKIVAGVGGGALLGLSGLNLLLKHADGRARNEEPIYTNKVRAVLSTSAISEENKLPGTDGWKFKKGGAGNIQGYASTTSVTAGETIEFMISTKKGGTLYHLQTFRLGYYQGKGGRLVDEAKGLKGIAQGWWSSKSGRNGLPEPDLVTKLLDLKWVPSYKWTVPTNAVSGYYLTKLTDAEGYETYIPFIVRDDKNAHDLMVQSSVATWHAYSAWGGHSYYGHYDNETHEYFTYDQDPKNNAVSISYNRPYEQGNGAGDLFIEYPTVYWLESHGYDIGYVSNIDTHLSRVKWKPKGFLSIGHDEYYSRPMREYLENFRDNGIHMAFLGANSIYWQSRYESNMNDSTLEPRIQTCYKYRAKSQDPVRDLKLLTTTWCQIDEPENLIVGQNWGSVVNESQDWVISNPTHWLFNGLKVNKGDKVNKLIGWEFDGVANHLFTPPNLEIIAASKVINKQNKVYEANSTIYEHWSKSTIFSSGTIYWGFGLANPAEDPRGVVSPIVQGVTKNLLDRFVGITV